MKQLKSMLKKISLVLICLFYGFAGLNHFLNPQTYLLIMPPYLPFPELLNYLSGGLEIIVAVLFCFPAYRKMASYTTIVMLISFFVVHIHHLQVGGVMAGMPAIPIWGLWLRIGIQFGFIAWAWWHRK